LENSKLEKLRHKNLTRPRSSAVLAHSAIWALELFLRKNVKLSRFFPGDIGKFGDIEPAIWDHVKQFTQ
jgi:hypothetical protein